LVAEHVAELGEVLTGYLGQHFFDDHCGIAFRSVGLSPKFFRDDVSAEKS
jgi:hypothetical protein